MGKETNGNILHNRCEDWGRSREEEKAGTSPLLKGMKPFL
jgi:hypothetical protein